MGSLSAHLFSIKARWLNCKHNSRLSNLRLLVKTLNFSNVCRSWLRSHSRAINHSLHVEPPVMVVHTI
ncbi:hypothetical protein M513_11052 [Trichuris suis]|uniref:Uncharacterized protein n=1 Tax=Trichuris suis TaxID=68888 RepID=A0A085LT13_9BILA|nr:hypothetical protein M513_11052 [Trichuris suis]